MGITYRRIGDSYSTRGDRALIRYAAAVVILTRTREDAERAKSEIAHWLQERGLSLSAEKTQICHLTEGFDFLGFKVRLC